MSNFILATIFYSLCTSTAIQQDTECQLVSCKYNRGMPHWISVSLDSYSTSIVAMRTAAHIAVMPEYNNV